ncbi:MAG: LptF/LptG family permease [Candidatus Coatesbacteria bacterium]
MKTLDRYLLRETVAPLGAGLGLFLFVLLADKLVDMLDLVFNRGVEASVVLRLLVCFLPSVIAISLPMAALLAAVLAFGRLTHDRELMAMKGAGLSLVRLAVPLAGLGIACSIVLVVFNGTILPAATTEYKRILLTIVRQRASVAFKERVFIREFDRYLLYFQKKVGTTGDLEDVTIVETPATAGTPPRIILARQGALRVDPRGFRVTLELRDGLMDQPADMEGEHYTRIEFQSYAVNLDIHDALKGNQIFVKGLDELNYADLFRRIRELRNVRDMRRDYEIALHQKIALAFAPLFVILIGAPLGSLARRGGGIGVLVSLFVIFVYYILLTTGQGLAQKGTLPPWVGMWAPNLFLAVAGVLAFAVASHEARWIRWGR